MARRLRRDFEGAWHHITNRGIAKRTLFERAEDVRFFLSRIARMVHREILEIHAFSILTNHFHMLVRSPEGEISQAMRRIQSEYSVRFNRKRIRDGPLVCGRFSSTLVGSDVYRDNVVRYIDANAIEAGLVAMPQWHHCSSAYWYGSRRRSPRWLERSWIEARVRDRCGCREFDPAAYLGYYQPKLSPDLEDWIMRRISAGEGARDPLDDLIASAPPKVLTWMQRNAEHADGTRAGIPLIPAAVLEAECLAREPELLALQQCARRRRGRPMLLSKVARAGLLFELAGLTAHEIGVRLGQSQSAVHRWVVRHRDLLLENGPYSRILAETVHSALHLIG